MKKKNNYLLNIFIYLFFKILYFLLYNKTIKIKMSDSEIYEFLKNKINKNKFTISLIEFYEKNNKFTKNQLKAVKKEYDNKILIDEKFYELMNDRPEIYYDNFCQSLNKFYEDKGYLTPKQINCLLKLNCS